LLLPDRSLSGRQFHSFSDAQGVDFLCLEKLYQSNFTAAKSNYGLSRFFVYLLRKKQIRKETGMKKFFMLLTVVLAVVVCCSGCDPKKTGGGKQQSYDRSNGQYK